MHEVSLCKNVLKIIERQALEQGFERVNTVFLEVGCMAGVEVEALRFGFDAVMKGSLADGAHLEIIDVPALAVCQSCNSRVEVKQRFDACPICGGFDLQLQQGDELRIKELEVE